MASYDIKIKIFLLLHTCGAFSFSMDQGLISIITSDANFGT